MKEGLKRAIVIAKAINRTMLVSDSIKRFRIVEELQAELDALPDEGAIVERGCPNCGLTTITSEDDDEPCDGCGAPVEAKPDLSPGLLEAAIWLRDKAGECKHGGGGVSYLADVYIDLSVELQRKARKLIARKDLANELEKRAKDDDQTV